MTGNGISEYCRAIGNILVLCDSIFSQYHTKQGSVTNDTIAILYIDLESLHILWIKLGLSVISKFYLLLSYLPNFLLQTNGFSDMTESRIERYYQEKEKDRI